MSMTFDQFFAEAERLNITLKLPLDPTPGMTHGFNGGPWDGKTAPLPGERVPLAIRVPDAELNGHSGIYKLNLKDSIDKGSENCPVYRWCPTSFPPNFPTAKDLDL